MIDNEFLVPGDYTPHIVTLTPTRAAAIFDPGGDLRCRVSVDRVLLTEPPTVELMVETFADGEDGLPDYATWPTAFCRVSPAAAEVVGLNADGHSTAEGDVLVVEIEAALSTAVTLTLVAPPEWPVSPADPDAPPETLVA